MHSEGDPYTLRMDPDVWHLRCLVAVVENGTFTDAAIELGVSQASVSRAISTLESRLGVRVLHRSSRAVDLTPAGEGVLGSARRILAELDGLMSRIASAVDVLRIGHAWSGLGRHTGALHRQWATAHPNVELQWVRTNSPSAGLLEGACDVSIVRSPLEHPHLTTVRVGSEERWLAVAADDPWASRRSVQWDEVPSRVLLIDRRTGTTSASLWPDTPEPRVRFTYDVDDWLSAIATGRGIGISSEATTVQYRREGVVYRRLRGAPRVQVFMAWDRRETHPATPDLVGLVTRLFGDSENA